MLELTSIGKDNIVVFLVLAVVAQRPSTDASGFHIASGLCLDNGRVSRAH